MSKLLKMQLQIINLIKNFLQKRLFIKLTKNNNNNNNNKKLIADFKHNFTTHGLKAFLKKIELNLSLLIKIISCITKFSYDI
jgi:hypothetical protein